jgi:hypothetical protein
MKQLKCPAEQFWCPATPFLNPTLAPNRAICEAILGVVAAAVVKPTIVVNQVFSLHTKVTLPHTKIVFLLNKLLCRPLKLLVKIIRRNI